MCDDANSRTISVILRIGDWQRHEPVQVVEAWPDADVAAARCAQLEAEWLASMSAPDQAHMRKYRITEYEVQTVPFAEKTSRIA